MTGVNYYDGSQFQEVAAVKNDAGNMRKVYRWDGSQWVQIFPTSSLVAKSNLIAHYEFDDSSTASTAIDSADTSDYGNSTSEDGSITGATYNGSGQVGSDSLNFDGTDDEVVVTDDGTLDFGSTDNFHISCWFKHTGGNDTSRLINNIGGGAGYELIINNSNNLTLSAEDSSGSSSSANATTDYGDGSWHLVNGLFDGDNGAMELFVDGSSIDRVGSNWDSNNNDFAIGSYNGSNYFNGLIDDVRIYNAKLSSSEVQEIYNNTK